MSHRVIQKKYEKDFPYTGHHGSHDRNAIGTMQTALDAVPYMDQAYQQRLRPYVEQYARYVDSLTTINPYGVPIGLARTSTTGLSSGGRTRAR